MAATLAEAARRGVDEMSIEVDEPDDGARRLYERHGFSCHLGGGADGPVMLVYEREMGRPAGYARGS